MKIHHLSRELFQGLAAGNGGPAAVREIFAARVSKHLFMLRAIADAVDGRGSPAAAARFADNFAALEEIEHADGQTALDVLSYPYVGAWLSTCLRDLHKSAPGHRVSTGVLDHLGGVALAAAIRAGVPVRCHVHIASGAVAVPTVGLLVVASRVGKTGPVDIGYDGTGGLTVNGRSVPFEWNRLRPINVRHRERAAAILVDDLDPYRDTRDLRAAQRLDLVEFNQWQARMQDAWRLLVDYHSHRAEEIGAGLHALTPLTPSATGTGRSATVSAAAGAVSLTMPTDAQELAATLIHEMQHTKLNCLLDILSLGRLGGEPLLYSPWRADPRPLWGVLHGAYAFLGVAEFWRAETGNPNAGHDLARFEFARTACEVQRGVATLLASGRLSETGVVLVRSLAERLESWRQEHPSDIDRVVHDLVDGDYVVWRIRNIEPSRDAVDAVIDTIVGTDPSAVRPSPAPVEAASPVAADRRLAAARAMVSSDEPVVADDPRTAEQRLAAGQYREAIAAYRADIADNPSNPASWAGLAVASARLGAAGIVAIEPELALAAFVSLAGAGYPAAALFESLGVPA